MSDYRIFETEEFKRQNTKLAQRRGISIDRKLEGYVYLQLKQDPHHGPNIKRLQGFTPPIWRYRIGDYRIFYTIDEREQIVFILTIDDRKDAYR